MLILTMRPHDVALVGRELRLVLLGPGPDGACRIAFEVPRAVAVTKGDRLELHHRRQAACEGRVPRHDFTGPDRERCTVCGLSPGHFVHGGPHG